MVDEKKILLFEEKPIPSAVMELAIPTVLSSLVMVIYNLADTYFVGMINDSIQNAAVTLAAPVLLAFNAVNNLFGVGSSSMMSRALGKKDYDTAYRSSAFGFYFALIFGVIFSIGYTIFKEPFLAILGTEQETIMATSEYLKWTVSFGAVPAILNVVMAYLVRSEGSTLHASIGTMSGCLLNIVLDPVFILPVGAEYGSSRSRVRYIYLKLCSMHLFFCTFICKKGKDHGMYQSEHVWAEKGDCSWCLCRRYSGIYSESSECDWYDNLKQFYRRVWS